jgi:hypothetical protein
MRNNSDDLVATSGGDNIITINKIVKEGFDKVTKYLVICFILFMVFFLIAFFFVNSYIGLASNSINKQVGDSTTESINKFNDSNQKAIELANKKLGESYRLAISEANKDMVEIVRKNSEESIKTAVQNNNSLKQVYENALRDLANSNSSSSESLRKTYEQKITELDNSTRQINETYNKRLSELSKSTEQVGKDYKVALSSLTDVTKVLQNTKDNLTRKIISVEDKKKCKKGSFQFTEESFTLAPPNSKNIQYPILDGIVKQETCSLIYQSDGLYKFSYEDIGYISFIDLDIVDGYFINLRLIPIDCQGNVLQNMTIASAAFKKSNIVHEFSKIKKTCGFYFQINSNNNSVIENPIQIKFKYGFHTKGFEIENRRTTEAVLINPSFRENSSDDLPSCLSVKLDEYPDKQGMYTPPCDFEPYQKFHFVPVADQLDTYTIHSSISKNNCLVPKVLRKGESININPTCKYNTKNYSFKVKSKESVNQNLLTTNVLIEVLENGKETNLCLFSENYFFAAISLQDCNISITSQIFNIIGLEKYLNELTLINDDQTFYQGNQL